MTHLEYMQIIFKSVHYQNFNKCNKRQEIHATKTSKYFDPLL